MKIDFVYDYGPAGDQCYGYKLRMERPCTVREFIEEILRQRPGEWGAFEITPLADYGYYTGRELRVEFEKGGKLKNSIPEAAAGKLVQKAKARGGWTAMDYFVAI